MNKKHRARNKAYCGYCTYAIEWYEKSVRVHERCIPRMNRALRLAAKIKELLAIKQ